MTSLYLLYAVQAGVVAQVRLVAVDLVKQEEVLALGHLVLVILVQPYLI